MKNKLINILIVLVLFMLPAVHAQQEWQWGKRVGIQANDIAVDQNGNTYVLWSLHGTTVIDGHTLTSNGSGDIALTSFNCDGDYRWSKVIGGSSTDVGSKIGVDTLGGVYLTGGIFSDSSLTINVSNDTVIAPTHKGMLLVKYDTAGNFQWLRMPESDNLTGPNHSGAIAMEVSPQGDCNLISILSPGSYGEGVFIATYPQDVLNNKGNGVYNLKYDRDGNCTGGIHFDMSYVNVPPIYFKFTIDPLTKNYLLASKITSSTDTIQLGNTLISKSLYLASFDSTGNVQWIQQNSNLSYGDLVKPEIDLQGSIYITGNVFYPDTLAGWPLSNSLGQHSFPFLLKLNPNTGNVIWGTNASANAAVKGKAVNIINNVVGVVGEYGKKINWGWIRSKQYDTGL